MSNTVTIFVDEDAWRVGLADGTVLPVPSPAEAHDTEDPDTRASAIATWLDEHPPHPDGVVLALPSRWCLAARFSIAELPRAGREQAMLYRLEEHLPLDAEDFTAGFLTHDGEALGVAVETARVNPILRALERQDLCIPYLCPAAFLYAESVLRDHPEQDTCLIARSHPDYVDLIVMRSQRPYAWRLVQPTAESVATELNTLPMTTDVGGRLYTAGLPPETVERVRTALQDEDASIEIATDTFDHLAAKSAAHVLEQGASPLIDLRQGALAGHGRLSRLTRPLTALALSGLVLIASLGAVCFSRAQSYTQRSGHAAQAQAALFEEVFPGQPPPVALLSRFRSEATKAQGVSGADRTGPARVSALHELAGLLAGLPEDLRFRLLDIQVDAQRLYLDGQARSHGDADRITAGLRDAVGFRVAPPRTQNLADRGVSFVISGVRPQEDAP